MMTTLTRRVAKLEAAGPTELSPWLKRWLGQSLSPEEQRLVNQHPEDPEPVDTSKLSPEMRAWLGMD